MAYTLIADAGSFTGSPHLQANRPAQDFTFTKTTPFGAYVVVSDGCSHGQLEKDGVLRKQGAIFHTDVGARLIALATAKVIEAVLPTLAENQTPRDALWHDIRAAQLAAMEHALAYMPLDALDLMATWLCAVVLPNGRYWVLGEGDGVVAIRCGSALVVTEYRWLKQPFYPAYRLEQEATFIAAYGTLETPALQVRVEGVAEDYDETGWTAPLGQALNNGIGEDGTLQPGDELILMTDGIGSLAKANQPTMNVYQAVQHFAALLKQLGPYRVRAGSTIAMRRLTHQGYVAHDDLSLASIAVFAPPTMEPEHETPERTQG
jgi:hypothetical protein